MRRFRPAALVAAAAAGAVVAACVQGSGFQYVSNRQAGAFVKVPEQWRVFDEDEARAGDGLGNALEWAVAFDGNRDPDAERFLRLDPSSAQPAGIVRVLRLNDAQRDTVSLQALRNLLVDVDGGAESGAVEGVVVEDVEQEEGRIRGQRVVFTVVHDDGSRFTVDQTALIDDEMRTIYVFAVGCEARCYEREREVIERVAGSMRVRSR